MDRFEEFLNNLGTILGIPLHPDKNRACQLRIHDTLHVLMTPEENKQSLLISGFICEVPPGKFKENVFKESLKANGAFPRVGTLGFCMRKNQLALFAYFPLFELKADQIANFLAQFIEKIEGWRSAIEKGTPFPSLEPTTTTIESLYGRG